MIASIRGSASRAGSTRRRSRRRPAATLSWSRRSSTTSPPPARGGRSAGGRGRSMRPASRSWSARRSATASASWTRSAANVLEVASVIGSEFGSDLVTEVSEMPGEDVIASLEAAVAAGLLADVPGTLDRYAFSHALFRQAVYAGVPRGPPGGAPPAPGRGPRAPARQRPEARRRAGAPLRRGRAGGRRQGARVRGPRRSRRPRVALLREGDRALQRGAVGPRCLRRGRPEAAARAAARPGRGGVARRGGRALARELRLRRPHRPLDRRLRGARPSRPRLLRLRLGAGRAPGRRGGAAEGCAGRCARADGAAGSPRRCASPRSRVPRASTTAPRSLCRRGARAGGAKRRPRHPGPRPDRALERRDRAGRSRAAAGDLSPARRRVIPELRDHDVVDPGPVPAGAGGASVGGLRRARRGDRRAREDRRADEAVSAGRLHSRAFMTTRSLMEGQFADAERLTAEVLELGAWAEVPDALEYTSFELAVLRWEQGRIGETEDLLRDLIGRRGQGPVWRSFLALLLSETGRADEAREEIDAVGGATTSEVDAPAAAADRRDRRRGTRRSRAGGEAPPQASALRGRNRRRRCRRRLPRAGLAPSRECWPRWRDATTRRSSGSPRRWRSTSGLARSPGWPGRASSSQRRWPSGPGRATRSGPAPCSPTPAAPPRSWAWPRCCRGSARAATPSASASQPA